MLKGQLRKMEAIWRLHPLAGVQAPYSRMTTWVIFTCRKCLMALELAVQLCRGKEPTPSCSVTYPESIELSATDLDGYVA